MDFPIWLGALGVIVLLTFFLFLWAKIDEHREHSRYQFKHEMVQAILHTQPSWQQMLDIAETSNVSTGTTYNLARQLHKDILIGASRDLQEHRPLIENYIATHKRTEPFEGLPNEVRIHLERLRDQLDGKEHYLEPLTIQIRELVSVHKKENRTQKRYSSWGFFIGVLGTLFAAYAYFFPYTGTSSQPPAKEQSTAPAK